MPRNPEWHIFTDPLHPVYERPEEDVRWPVGPPGMRPAPYQDAGQGLVAEPLIMEAVGHPSVDIHKAGGGGTVQQVSLHSERYAAAADLGDLQEVVDDWLQSLEAMSYGPYSSGDLRRMGHPYGYGQPGPWSWARLSHPRALPPMGRPSVRADSAAHIPGIRGRVANRDIINYQTGVFAKSWSARVMRWYGGVNVLFANTTFYSWFLAHGTYKMQAHGPWQRAQSLFLDRLMSTWRTATWRVWRERTRQQQAVAQLMQDTFGPEAMMQQARSVEAGGFA